MEDALSMVPSLVVLGLAAWAAGLLVLRRQSPPERQVERRAASVAFGLAIGAQAIHFTEELAGGLHHRLGALVGVPPIPLALFVLFNLLWLGIWVAAVPGLRAGHSFAFFVAWFLAIAGMVNGIAHPLLTVAAGAYFPGVLSSPLIGAAGVWLGVRLVGASEPRRQDPVSIGPENRGV